MEQFNLQTFVRQLKDLFLNNPNMPLSTEYYMNNRGYLQLDREKHPKREPLHLKDAISNSFENSSMNVDENVIVFDIGNERMEQTHPYYHILENTPYIRIKDQGTEKTRGSQAKVEKIGSRDYEIVEWNGKTFSKEYSRNVRGSRNRDETTTRRYGNVLVKRQSSSYKNDHYRYIERIIDSINPLLAQMFGLKLARTESTGLAEEYFSQFTDNTSDIQSAILETFYSFE